MGRRVWAAVAVSVAFGCAATTEDASESASAATALRSVIVHPQRDGVASVDEREAAGETTAGNAPLPVFLNRSGGTYLPGDDDSSKNLSWIVKDQGLASAVLPAYGGSASDWTRLVACVQDEFARFNVTVVDAEPAAGPYIEAVIGGDGSEVGFNGGVGGVATLDDENCTVISTAVVFIFTETVGTNPIVACEVAAQEIAHAMSLDHELLASDPMTYLSYNGHKTFQDKEVSCGEFWPKRCICNGAKQNSVQVLATKLGWVQENPPSSDTTPPEVSSLTPADGAVFPAHARMKVIATVTDDVGVNGVELLWRYNGNNFRCPGRGKTWSCTVTDNVYTWSIGVGAGTRPFQLRAVDAAGNATVTPVRTLRFE